MTDNRESPAKPNPLSVMAGELLGFIGEMCGPGPLGEWMFP
jgi:hypothetical protein